MLLTSYQRMLRYIHGRTMEPLSTDDDQLSRRDLLPWINSVSENIEQYLGIETEIVSRTEYFDVGWGQREYWVKGTPINSIASVKEDPTGLFDGSESTLTAGSDYHIGTEEISVVTLLPRGWEGDRGIQIAYTGGLASHGTQSEFVTASSSGWTVDDYCIGNSSAATGIVSSISGNNLTVDVLYGVFVVDEIIAEYSDEGTTATGVTTTINSKASIALCESSFSSITSACENEIRYLWEHRMDFENDGSQRDGVTIRRSAGQKASMQPETRMMLDPYVVPRF